MNDNNNDKMNVFSQQDNNESTSAVTEVYEEYKSDRAETGDNNEKASENVEFVNGGNYVEFVVKNESDAIEKNDNANEINNPAYEFVRYTAPAIETPSVYIDTIEKDIKKHKKSFGYFAKRAVAIIVSAALFGVVAGGSFQFVSRKMQPKNSVVQAGAIDETDPDFTEDFNNNKENAKDDNSDIVKIKNKTEIDSTDVSTVVENVMPAIVAINCTGEAYYNYFGRQYSQEISGSGSGIIIGQNASEILIVTNNHVISNANVIEIVFADGSTAKASMKGSEAASDLAVVTVNVNDLSKDTLNSIKVAALGNSEELKMGQMAIAIGNALGYGQSVTVGYISALNREITVEGVTLNLIQTDAAINPGNSGGALLNIKGEVIGINSLKHAETNVEGIGYAIPISEVVPIINELMNREVLELSESGYLGISGKSVEQDLVVGFNLPVGVYVYSVAEGSPADKAGLKAYDIITGIQGKKITNMTELKNVLSYTKAGTEVELTVMSLENGTYIEKTINVVLGNIPK